MDAPAPDPHRPLRVGLAGLGRFGALHAAVLSALPEVQLAAIADPDLTLLQQIGDRYGVDRRHRDAQNLIHDPDLDALVLVTPDEAQPATLRVRAYLKGPASGSLPSRTLAVYATVRGITPTE